MQNDSTRPPLQHDFFLTCPKMTDEELIASLQNPESKNKSWADMMEEEEEEQKKETPNYYCPQNTDLTEGTWTEVKKRRSHKNDCQPQEHHQYHYKKSERHSVNLFPNQKKWVVKK